jgi:hypothetical protein
MFIDSHEFFLLNIESSWEEILFELVFGMLVSFSKEKSIKSLTFSLLESNIFFLLLDLSFADFENVLILLSD